MIVSFGNFWHYQDPLRYRDRKAVACIKIKHTICCLQHKSKIEEKYFLYF